MTKPNRSDLLVLVADKNMEVAVTALLSRHVALEIRQVAADIRRHPQKDSGSCLGGVSFLQPFAEQYEHALLIFDHEGSSRENEEPSRIEEDLEKQLSRTGWGQRASVIVLTPELESWVWSDSPHVEKALGWVDAGSTLREWLIGRGCLATDERKPGRPKEAMEAVLWKVKKPRSSAIYQALAQTVSVKRCRDRAFGKFKSRLSEWFSASE